MLARGRAGRPARRRRPADRRRPLGAGGAETRGRRQILRLAVAVAAVAQLALAVPVLLSGLGVAADPHTSREMASFDIALAVGFALAAYRPARARAFVPVAFVLAACLAATSAVDMANASTAHDPRGRSPGRGGPGRAAVGARPGQPTRRPRRRGVGSAVPASGVTVAYPRPGGGSTDDDSHAC